MPLRIPVLWLSHSKLIKILLWGDFQIRLRLLIFGRLCSLFCIDVPLGSYKRLNGEREGDILVLEVELRDSIRVKAPSPLFCWWLADGARGSEWRLKVSTSWYSTPIPSPAREMSWIQPAVDWTKLIPSKVTQLQTPGSELWKALGMDYWYL